MSTYKLPKIEELLEAGVHFGHQTRRWHPKMEPYIYGVKQNIHIIDLEITHKNLKKACEFLYETAKKGGKIIFVGTKKQARDIVSIEAKRSGAMYVIERWIGGTITNYRVIKENINRLLSTIKQKEAGELEKYTKKERLLIDRKIEKLQRAIGGITALKGIPAAILVIDAKREKTAVHEANRAGVPVVALIDTNSDPAGLEYIIPGNDDALKSIALVLKTVSDAIEEGYVEFGKELEKAELAHAEGVKEKANQEAEAIESAKRSETVSKEALVISTSEAVRVGKAVAKEAPKIEKTPGKSRKSEKSEKPEKKAKLANKEAKLVNLENAKVTVAKKVKKVKITVRAKKAK